jgi:pyruvate dehydrogenase E1 component alpha subunit
MAIFAKAEDMHPTENISDLAAGYGMPSVVVDGQDVIACAEAALTAIEHCRAGKGPYMIEAKTLRFQSHAVGIPDLVDFTPRDAEELKKMQERDPVILCEQSLLDEGVLTQELIEQYAVDSRNEIDEINQFIAESPVADTLDLSNIDKLVYAD